MQAAFSVDLVRDDSNLSYKVEGKSRPFEIHLKPAVLVPKRKRPAMGPFPPLRRYAHDEPQKEPP